MKASTGPAADGAAAGGVLPDRAVDAASTRAEAAGSGLVPREFLSRPALEVAPDLLGCVLEHESADGLVAVMLTEVEAYSGAVDPASHAYRGRTPRNAVMFGPPGYSYVYFTYGMHFCVNIVCMPEGTANAVLLRAGKIIVGEDLASTRRHPREPKGAAMPGLRSEEPATRDEGRHRAKAPGGERDSRASGASTARGIVLRDLARGPARLCQALGIDRNLNGANVCVPDSPLRLRAPLGEALAGEPGDGTDGTDRSGQKSLICTGPRVGVREGADVPWRFWLAGEPTVSVYRAYARRRR